MGFEENLNKMYQEIANKINEMIPAEWEQVYTMAYINEESEEVFFNYTTPGSNDLHYYTAIPEDYSVCLDHMKPEKTLIKDMNDDDLHKAIDRAINVKKGEFFIAREIQPSDQRLKSDKAFLQFIEETFDAFLRFYQ